MGRLGDNPHIVTIHDTGDENGAPFIVSQLHGRRVRRGSLHQGGARAPLPADRDALQIAGQVCQALAARPRPRHHPPRPQARQRLARPTTARPPLGDFGLAIAIDRSRLTHAGHDRRHRRLHAARAGPRPLRPTPRSDLYALGAMLYEMVVWTPALLGDDAVAIISQHTQHAAVAPSWHNKEIGADVEALVLELLEKDPTARPASAGSVRKRIQEIQRAPAPPVERDAALEPWRGRAVSRASPSWVARRSSGGCTRASTPRSAATARSRCWWGSPASERPG